MSLSLSLERACGGGAVLATATILRLGEHVRWVGGGLVLSSVVLSCRGAAARWPTASSGAPRSVVLWYLGAILLLAGWPGSRAAREHPAFLSSERGEGSAVQPLHLLLLSDLR